MARSQAMGGSEGRNNTGGGASIPRWLELEQERELRAKDLGVQVPKEDQ